MDCAVMNSAKAVSISEYCFAISRACDARSRSCRQPSGEDTDAGEFRGPRTSGLFSIQHCLDAPHGFPCRCDNRARPHLHQQWVQRSGAKAPCATLPRDMNDAFSLVPDAPEHAFDPLDRDYAGFIFDCDGTLADSMPLHFKAWRTAFSAYGAPFDFTWELFLQRAGKTLEVTVDELNVEFNTRLDRDAVTRIQRETYRKFLPQVGPVRPVLDFVRSIAGHYPMAVASGSDRSSVTTTLASLAILDLFSVIVTGDDVVHGK